MEVSQITVEYLYNTVELHVCIVFLWVLSKIRSLDFFYKSVIMNSYTCKDFHNLIIYFDEQGLFQKAEALYQKGDFETALMYYHRGHKLRPELQEFRLGIQKSQEAINNSIGSMIMFSL